MSLAAQEVEVDRQAMRDEWEERMRRIDTIQLEAEQMRRNRSQFT